MHPDLSNFWRLQSHLQLDSLLDEFGSYFHGIKYEKIYFNITSMHALHMAGNLAFQQQMGQPDTDNQTICSFQEGGGAGREWPHKCCEVAGWS